MSEQPNDMQTRPPTADVGQQLRDKIKGFDVKMARLTQALDALRDEGTAALWGCLRETPEGIVADLQRRRSDFILAKSAAETILALMERVGDMRELLQSLAMLDRYDAGVPIFGRTNFAPASVGRPAV